MTTIVYDNKVYDNNSLRQQYALTTLSFNILVLDY